MKGKKAFRKTGANVLHASDRTRGDMRQNTGKRGERKMKKQQEEDPRSSGGSAWGRTVGDG